jgi:2-polyprenyl-3-methyl-5-hydroxy-6-metoxy-1,4-benzoquinol methylase
MGEPDTWQRRVEEFVLGQIGNSPIRVLEVGCGEGELARTLARVGHSVTAIDPQAPEAPEGPIFRRTRIEEFTDPAQFDHVVGILSLHHVEDLGMALSNMADLLRAGEPWSYSSSLGTGSTRPRRSGP